MNAEIPLAGLRWIISHMPDFPVDLANRMNAMGMGVLVGWGPLRNGTNVGPPYRMLMTHPIKKGYHSDGGDITVINPWLNFSTIVTGKNLAGQPILGDQTLTRQEMLWLATAANKWFIEEDDLGSIEAGNHADLAVLDRDFFTVPDAEITRTRSLLTLVGGKDRPPMRKLIDRIRYPHPQHERIAHVGKPRRCLYAKIPVPRQGITEDWTHVMLLAVPIDAELMCVA